MTILAALTALTTMRDRVGFREEAGTVVVIKSQSRVDSFSDPQKKGAVDKIF